MKTAVRSAGALAAAWVLTWTVGRLVVPAVGGLHKAFWAGEHSWTEFLRDRLADSIELSGFGSYFAALLLATVLVPLGFAVRTMVRARVRAGHADPLARARRWMAAHPRGALAPAAVLPAAFTWFQAMEYFGQTNPDLARYFGAASIFDKLAVGAIGAVPALVAFAGLTWLARAGLRAFVAPTLEEGEAPRDDVSRDEIAFDAVAVTLETRAAVVGMAALPFALVALLNALDAHKLASPGVTLATIMAYVVTALGGAVLFQRASRIAVGLDGVFVSGSSRTRFFAYRDLDSARVNGNSLELVRQARTVLRLQLHGEDAARRQAVLARIQTAVARAKEERRDVTTDFVSSASSAALSRVAQGAGDYRAAAVSREQLWAVVEGPAIDTAARCNAAEALASSGDRDERARLRFAADHCADPQVRVALQKLTEVEELEEPEEAPAPRRRAPAR